VVDAPDRGESTMTGGTFSLISAQAAPTQSVIGPAAAALIVIVVGAFAHRRMTGPPRMPVVARPTGRNSRLISPRARRAVSIVGAVTALWIVGPLPFTVAISLVLLLRRLRPIRAGRRRRAAIERALPDAMDQLVSSVRAGLTPFQAVCDLAGSTDPAIGDAFAEVVRRTERGQPFADALAALPQRLGAQAGGLADVIATSDRHGLPLGPVLDQLTTEIRATRRRLDQADARKLPVRLSFPLVTCTLPSFVLLAIAPAVIAALSSLGASAW
jgi:tight adherence protein C